MASVGEQIGSLPGLAGHLAQAIVASTWYGAPVDGPFVPRRGQAGWVREGKPWDSRFPASCRDWVWQEANNGAITFYSVTVDDRVITLMQHSAGEAVYWRKDDEGQEGTWSRLNLEVPSPHQWMCMGVQERGRPIFEPQLSQAGGHTGL